MKDLFKPNINGHISYLNLEAAWPITVNDKSVLDRSVLYIRLYRT